jgi:hypothetical protein
MQRFAATLTALAAAALTTNSFAAVSTTDRVQAFSTESYTWVAEENGEAIISIDGDGDTDLDLIVYDRHGNLIASDVSTDDVEQVIFNARAGQRYTIEVENLGNVYNEFAIEVMQPTWTLNERVYRHDTHPFSFTTATYGTATVTLHGDGDTDLDLRVYDRFGRLIAESESIDDHETVSFDYDPKGDYTIEVINLGGVYNDFVLAVED